ncbi:hypothetical protein V3C99_012078, partial [Haemonchus contortus]
WNRFKRTSLLQMTRKSLKREISGENYGPWMLQVPKSSQSLRRKQRLPKIKWCGENSMNKYRIEKTDTTFDYHGESNFPRLRTKRALAYKRLVNV